MKKYNQVTGPYLELFDWIQEHDPKTIKELVTDIQLEYSLSTLEGIEAGRTYPNAAQNLRFLHEFSFQLECLCTDIEIPENEK